MLIKILLVIAILIQSVATAYALKLVRATKYNSVWILFIVGFSLLSVERLIQLLLVSGFEIIPRWWFGYLGIVISVCLSIGVMYAHKLFKYINRLNRQRSLLNKRILTAVLRTEEKARSRFSKELHDGLGPLLSSAKMSLTALAREEHDAEQREIIDNTTYVIDEAIRSLREISNNLSPHVLNDFGLARGVQNFIDKSAAMHDVKIRFTTNLRAERFDTDVEVILYRVICELINNSLKHAACSSINLSLSQNGSELTLDYTDNGRGFNPQAMMDCGMGLSNIASRINSLGGTFDIASAKGKGMRAAIRVAALSGLPVTYILTHDSVAVGEDGPTHQPVETVSGLRVIPNLDVIRPADPEETAGAWMAAMQRADGPTALILTRQKVATLNNIPVETRREGVLKGGYVARKEQGTLKAIILASGSELELALKAAEKTGEGIRVVSMPSFFRFDRQSAEYRESVLPSSCAKRVSVEAGVTDLWWKYLGCQGEAVGINRFGFSAPGAQVLDELGMNVDNVVASVQKVLAK